MSSSQTLIIQQEASGGPDCEQPGKPRVVVELLSGEAAGRKAAVPLSPILMEQCKDMYLSRFTLPLGALYRLYVDARVSDTSPAAAAAAAAAGRAETTAIPSISELGERLKHLCPLHVVRQLNQGPDEAGLARLELDFADYLGVCGPRQRCQCSDQPAGDVSMGGDSVVDEQLFIGACDVIAESKRAPVELSTGFKPRFCDVTASSRESLLMTTVGHDVIHVIHAEKSDCSKLGTTAGNTDGGMQLKQWKLIDCIDQPFLRDKTLDVVEFLRTISELLPWLEAWLDKQAPGRSADDVTASSLAAAAAAGQDGSKDEPTAYAEMSAVDAADEKEARSAAAAAKSSQMTYPATGESGDNSWDSDSDDNSIERVRSPLKLKLSNNDSSHGSGEFEVPSGVIKSKAVSCPLVIKNWTSDKTDGTSDSAKVAGDKLPPDVNSDASTHSQVFESWDAWESSESDAGDAVAMAMSRDSTDVITVLGRKDAAAAETVDIRSPVGVIDDTVLDDIETWDSEDEQDQLTSSDMHWCVASLEKEKESETRRNERAKMTELEYLANNCTYDYPGVRVEWCPDPSNLFPRRPGDDVTAEPEVWQSDSGSSIPTMPLKSDSVVDGQRGKQGETGSNVMNAALADGSRSVDEDALWKMIFDDDADSTQQFFAQPPDGTSSRQAAAAGHPSCKYPADSGGAETSVEDPDTVELLLDGKPSAAAAAAGGDAGDVVGSRRNAVGVDARRGLRLWQRFRHQMRDFRFRVARRFSRIFTRRRRYHAAAAPTQSDEAKLEVVE